MLLRLENIFKEFQKKYLILNGVNLHIEEGEIVGLVGKSGCGKSTLARITMQLEKATAGLVYFNGIPIRKSNRKLFYENCRIIFQNTSTSFNPSWTVKQILLESLKGTKKDKHEYICQMLSKVNLTEAHLSRYPSELSGGEKQRVNILRSILTEPKLLICDEVVSNLDQLLQKEIIDLLISLKLESNMAILFISHDLRVVEYMCKRIYVMKSGEIIDEGIEKEGNFIFSQPYSKKLFNLRIGGRDIYFENL